MYNEGTKRYHISHKETYLYFWDWNKQASLSTVRHWIHRGLCFHGNRLRDKQTAREINHPINKTTSNRVSACTAGAYAMLLVAALIKIISILLRCLQAQQRRYVSTLSTSPYQFGLSGNQTRRRGRVISRACRQCTSSHDRCQWEEGSFYMQSLRLLHQTWVLMSLASQIPHSGSGFDKNERLLFREAGRRTAVQHVVFE